MPLIEGSEGVIEVGPIGTPQTVAYITEWEANPKTDIKTNGPFIGNAAKAKTRAGKDVSGSMKGLVPQGRDAGQSALITAHEDGADIRVVLTTDDGYVLTIPLTIVSDLKVGQKADEGAPFECSFTDNNGYTLVPVV